MILAFLQANPIEPISKYGPYLGSALICTGLFIWSQIQMYMLKNTLEKHTAAQVAANTELKGIVEKMVAAQSEQAASVHHLADAIQHQTGMHQEQLALIREMSTEQKLLAQAQMTTIQGFQKVVDSLIDAVKG